MVTQKEDKFSLLLLRNTKKEDHRTIVTKVDMLL